MSVDLEQIGNYLFDNKVPKVWGDASYPSLKPLAACINDLVKRLEFMNKWIRDGAPSSFGY